MWKRIWAIFVARNREFFRDRVGLGWNLVMPLLMLLAFAVIFRGSADQPIKVGVLGDTEALPTLSTPFLSLQHIDFVPQTQREKAIDKVEHHQLDLLIDPRQSPLQYWVNRDSSQGYLAERLLLGTRVAPPAGADAPTRHEVSGAALSYVDWVLPGILAMNVMFASLWGIGWVIVRYRRNGVLRRLRATPLKPFEFLTAQILSRILVVLTANTIVYIVARLALHAPMNGSYLALILVYAAGALCMICLALIVAARLRTEELADGLLNMLSLPMLLLSGLWYSMEGTSAFAQAASKLMPLTYLVSGSRQVMLDGAGVVQVLPQVGILVLLAACFLAIAVRLFRWE